MKNYFTLLFLMITMIAAGQGKPKIIVETDMGGDKDDQATFIRFLLYANELDIQGIILSRAKLGDPESANPSNAGNPYEMATHYIAAYGTVQNNLKQKDSSYPTANALINLTKWAHRPNSGGNDGVNLIINALKNNPGKPIWYVNWGCNDGSISSLKKALDRIENNQVPGLNYNDVVDQIYYIEYHNLVAASPLKGMNLPQE